eukprot:scaffold247808_cov35-Tisochrysis_lutea.AAC.6
MAAPRRGALMTPLSLSLFPVTAADGAPHLTQCYFGSKKRPPYYLSSCPLSSRPVSPTLSSSSSRFR